MGCKYLLNNDQCQVCNVKSYEPFQLPSHIATPWLFQNKTFVDQELPKILIGAASNVVTYDAHNIGWRKNTS